MDEETLQATASIDQSILEENMTDQSDRKMISYRRGKKERKSSSYVWNYCEKLSRHTIRCKLCMKIMSFHGTANVITHLERRHNVLEDKLQTSITEPSPIDVVNDFEEQNRESLNQQISLKKKCRILTTASIVWKYCTRISQEKVRCCLCKKNLSYKGTSNLQRHLHRMHGILTRGRTMMRQLIRQYANIKQEGIELPPDVDLLWQFCTQIDCGKKIKCNMCSVMIDSKETETIVKHLRVVHSVQFHPKHLDKKATTMLTRKRKRQVQFGHEATDDSNFDEEFIVGTHLGIIDDESNFQQNELDENNSKRDDCFYDEFIEEDHGNYDEEPSNSNDTGQCNPPSVHTSRNNSPEVFVSLSNQNMQISNQQLLKLQEDRLRSETEYFREKAGYYRMLKCLTALQARKTRVELEASNHIISNIINRNELNGSYSLNISLPPHMTNEEENPLLFKKQQLNSL